MPDLFTYGSLKSGCRLNRILTHHGARLVYPNALTSLPHRLIGLSRYPIMYRDHSELGWRNHYVIGEVWDAPSSLLEKITEMELAAGYASQRLGIEIYSHRINALYPMHRDNPGPHDVRYATTFIASSTYAQMSNSWQVSDVPRGFFVWPENMAASYSESVVWEWREEDGVGRVLAQSCVAGQPRPQAIGDVWNRESESEEEEYEGPEHPNEELEYDDDEETSP